MSILLPNNPMKFDEQKTTARPGRLDELADFLSNGFWEGVGVNARYHNLGSSGLDPNQGVLHYNLSGFTNNNIGENLLGFASDPNGLTNNRAELVREAFKVYETVLGIEFRETKSDDPNVVDFFFTDNNSGAWAWSDTFSGIITNEIDYSIINIERSWNGGTSNFNDYTLQTALHEIGHALGLGHQGLYNAGGKDPITYSTHALFTNDSWQTTMMSYFDQLENTAITADFALLQTPMVVDWIALDKIYGHQGFGTSNAFQGDTVFGFNTNISSAESQIWSKFFEYGHVAAHTIVDGGGNDTLDLSGYANNNLINLAPSQGSAYKVSVSDIGGKKGNLSIAEGTIIENAIGGAGSEVIIGNSANNILVGNAGNDSIYGGTGNDVIRGDSGSDKLHGQGGIDTVDYSHADGSVTVNLRNGVVSGADGNDRLTGFENANGSSYSDIVYGSHRDNQISGFGGNDELVGLGGNDKLFGHLGKDHLIGGNGDDFLIGGPGNDKLQGNDGNDILDGGRGYDVANYANETSGIDARLWKGVVTTSTGIDTLLSIEGIGGSKFNDKIFGSKLGDRIDGYKGNDIIVGLNGDDVLRGDKGNDTIFGNVKKTGGGSQNETDKLFGEEGNDRLFGSNGADHLYGGSGNDRLQGNAGNDELYGGAGSDLFVFASRFGTDRVHDFEDGSDRLSVSVGSFEELTFSADSDDIVIVAGHGSIVLETVGNSVSLTEEDFVFA